MKPMPKLCAIVAYYPTKLPNTNTMFPPNTNVVIHMAGDQPMAPKQSSYSYPDTETGFAEKDLDEYDKVAASLAWSRSLAAVRKGFGIEVDLEKVWEEHLDRMCCTGLPIAVMACLSDQLLTISPLSRVQDQRRRPHNGNHGL